MTPREQREAVIAALSGHRRVKGKTCEQLSKEMGLHKGAIGRWERGAGMRLDSVIAWAAQLGLIVKLEKSS